MSKNIKELPKFIKKIKVVGDISQYETIMNKVSNNMRHYAQQESLRHRDTGAMYDNINVTTTNSRTSIKSRLTSDTTVAEAKRRKGHSPGSHAEFKYGYVIEEKDPYMEPALNKAYVELKSEVEAKIKQIMKG